VYGVADHEGYLNRVGAAALLSIKANPVIGYAQGLDRK
jgi:hypothetical protein